MAVEEFDEEDSLVRPFLLTKGRTRSTGVPVVMESLIDRNSVEDDAYRRMDRTKRDIYDLLSERLSAAEVSAKLKLPLGVICVLVGDMGGDGVLQVHKAADVGDEQLLRRLIDGVRAL